MRVKSKLSSRRGIALLVVGIVVPLLIASSGTASIVSFSAPSRLGGGAEPEVTVAADGTLFVDAPLGLPGHSSLWRIDPGKSPKQLTFTSPYNRLPGGGDSAVALTPAAGGKWNVYFLDLYLVSNSLSVSHDSGETWTFGTPLTTLPPSDRQWIAATQKNGADTLWVTYAHGTNIGLAKSTDGGITWIPGYVSSGGALPAGGRPRPIIADGDFVATDYMSAGQATIVWSTDGGATWRTSKPGFAKNATENIANMAIDGNDVWITYTDRVFKTQVVHGTFTAGRASIEWERGGFPTEVNTPDSSNIFPWIAARNGKVSVSWYADPAHPGAPDSASGPWSLMYSEFQGHDEFDNMVFSAPAVAAANVKSGPVCTGGISCTANRELGDFQTIAIDQNGKAVIAFVRNGSVSLVREL